MTFDTSSVPKLTTNSQRLNRLIIVLGAMGILLISNSFWAMNRVIQSAQDGINQHFARLIGDINEHERFLRETLKQSEDVDTVKDTDTVPVQHALLGQRNGLVFYEGREFSFAMPFSLIHRDTPLDLTQDTGAFRLGVALANFYSRFWSLSDYPAPQSFIVNTDGSTYIAVPAFGNMPLHEHMTWQTYPKSLDLMRQQLRNMSDHQTAPGVHWAATSRFITGHLALMSSIKFPVGDFMWWKHAPHRNVLLVSILDIQRINNYAFLGSQGVFDRLDLISPKGEALLGQAPNDAGYKVGVNYTLNGVVVKAVSAAAEPWSAYYRISYAAFFKFARWQILGALLLALSVLVAGWIAKRWYNKRVIKPASEAHQHLIESESFSRTVIQTAPVAMCVVRHRDHQLMLHNRLTQAWLGSPEDISQWIRKLCRIKPNQPFEQPIASSIHKVGERYLHASFAATRYKGEQAILCVMNDVSAHKAIEKTLAKAKRDADAASDAKSVFLATMSHEIRTPLYGVLGTVELLGLTRLDRQQRNYVDTIQGSSETLLQLISDILDVSKIEAGQMPLERIDFSPVDILEESLRLYAGNAAAKGLQLYSCVDTNVPDRVQGDASRIRQIINNLLSNALKFTDQGRVVVRLKIRSQNQQTATLQWQVTDTGVGIAQEQQGRLFDSFYQVSDNHTISGTGLGLTICDQLCRLMGGRFHVVSEEGLGSSFTLELPLKVLPATSQALNTIQIEPIRILLRAPLRELSESLGAWFKCWGLQLIPMDRINHHEPSYLVIDVLSSPSDITQPRANVMLLADASTQPELINGSWQVSVHSLRGIVHAIQAAERGELKPEQEPSEFKTIPKSLNLNVLVAEDNPINQALLAEQLETLGCRSFIYNDGQEALSQLDERTFDVLLTDLNMPNIDGFELTHTVRAKGLRLPIIGVTANALREEVQRGKEAGMDAWLVKPISLQALYNCLSRIVIGHDSSLLAEPSAEQNDTFQVSEKMLPLFKSTMFEDLKLCHLALENADLHQLKQLIHRIRGALAVVQAKDLEAACGNVERHLSSSNKVELEIVRALVSEIEAAISSL